MAQRERGIFRMILKHFVNSFRMTNKKDKLIGEDFFGTKYYEEVGSKKKAIPRYFVPKDKENFEQELPAEWEAWLRHRRREPPTDEEVENNQRLAMMKKKNAIELDAKFAESRTPRLEVSTPKRGQLSFPTYEEYKNGEPKSQ